MKHIVLLLVCTMFIGSVSADIITVAKDGSGDFLTIQEGIDHAWDGDIIVVYSGTYNENVYFNGLGITLTSTNPDDTYVVESTVISAPADYTAYFDMFETSDSVLTGFTIMGRGIYCSESSPTITKNIIRNCVTAGIEGGTYPTTPSITDNMFKNNSGYCISGCGASSINVEGGVTLDGIISENIFTKNTNTCIAGCTGVIENNRIYGNSGSGISGGSVINNNIIAGNHGTGIEGICEHAINNTIVGNKNYGIEYAFIVKNNIIVSNGTGIANYAEAWYNDVWGNETDYAPGTPPGFHDINKHPLFALDGHWDPNGTPSDDTDDYWVDGDYHLRSEAGRWDDSGQVWIEDILTSPCIDAGGLFRNIGLEPYPNGGRINMGAYGGTAEASKSNSGFNDPVCRYPLKMDFNEDCSVNLLDFAIFCEEWLKSGFDISVELERDLLTVRSAVDLYVTEHGGLLPGAGDVPFVEALTGTTDSNGNVGTDLGPYINAIPYNSYTDLNTVDIDGAIRDGSHGWHFDSVTGAFEADHDLLLAEIIYILDELRWAIDSYKDDHDDMPPTLPYFVAQMTLYTDIFGQASQSYDESAGFIYGPYLQVIPLNPINDSQTVAAVETVTVGWVYDEITGDIYVSPTDLDPITNGDLILQLQAAGAALQY